MLHTTPRWRTLRRFASTLPFAVFCTFFLIVSSSHSQSALSGKPQIAVLNLEGRGISENDAATLSERLRGQLVKTNAFIVIDRENMDKTLGEQGFQMTGCTRVACAVRAGQILNAKKIVLGSIGKLGATYVVDISVIDVESGQFEKSFSKDHRGKIEGVLQIFEEIVVEVAADVPKILDGSSKLKDRIKIYPKPTNAPPTPRASTVIDDRMSIAILPFETKDIGVELGDIDLLDKITTVFFNLHRFKVIERVRLEKVLEEQKLGLTGIIDASTAAEIGKVVGVDAVVCGSIARAANTASIDARLIATETAAIITAQDAYADNLSLPVLNQMIQDAANKIRNDLPIVTGYVIEVDQDRVTLDLGSLQGVRKGMKCHIYRVGDPIIHPVTKQVRGKKIEELCEVQLIEVFDGHSTAIVTKAKNGVPQSSDRVEIK